MNGANLRREECWDCVCFVKKQNIFCSNKCNRREKLINVKRNDGCAFFYRKGRNLKFMTWDEIKM